jgi:hypothetical protein
LYEGQNGSDNSSPDASVPTPAKKRRRPSGWLVLVILLVIVLLLGGIGGWLALEQNSLLVFAGSSDSSLGTPLWHYHSDNNVIHQINWLAGGTELTYDSETGSALRVLDITTGHSSGSPAPFSAEASSCPAQQCFGRSNVAPDGRYISEVDDSGPALAINLRIWDLQAGDQKIVDYTQAVTTSLKQGPGAIWSSDATYVAVAGGTGWLLVWHAVSAFCCRARLGLSLTFPGRKMTHM